MWQLEVMVEILPGDRTEDKHTEHFHRRPFDSWNRTCMSPQRMRLTATFIYNEKRTKR